MFEKLGTPKFLAEARTQGKRRSVLAVLFIVLILFGVGNVLQSAVLTPILYVMMLADPAYYDIVNGSYDSTEEMAEAVLGYTAALSEAPLVSILSLFLTAGTVAACIVYVKLIEKRSLASCGMRKEGAAPAYLRGLALGLLLFAVAISFSALFGAVRFTGINPDFNPVYFVLLLLGFVIQGFAEELLCRGVLMVSTAKSAPLSYALLSSSIIFAMLHTPNSGFDFLSFVNLTLFGLLMGLYMIRGGSIWGAAALHAVWNFAEGVLIGFSVSGMKLPTYLISAIPTEGMELFIGGAFGPEGGLGVTFALTVALALFAMAPTKSSMTETVTTPPTDLQ